MEAAKITRRIELKSLTGDRISAEITGETSQALDDLIQEYIEQGYKLVKTNRFLYWWHNRADYPSFMVGFAVGVIGEIVAVAVITTTSAAHG